MTELCPKSRNSQAKGEKRPLPHGWIVLPSKSFPNQVYYFNTETRCSTWENPCKSENPTIRRLQNPTKSISYSSQENSASHAESTGSVSSISNRSLDDDNNSMIVDEDVAEYDEDHNDYFDNVPMNTFSLRRANVSSPPNSPGEILPQPHVPSSKIIPMSEPKELWTWFRNTPTPKTNRPIKSLILSDLDNTVKNMKDVPAKKPEEKKVVHSKVLSDSSTSTPAQSRIMKIHQANANTSPKKDALRFSKSEKNDPKFKKTAENAALAKKIPKLSIVLGNQMEEIKNSSPLSDIYKKVDKPTTSAQSRLVKIREENAESVKKNSKISKVLNDDSPKKFGNLSFSEALSKQLGKKDSLLKDRFQRVRKEFVDSSEQLKRSSNSNTQSDLSNNGIVGKKKKKIHFAGATRTEYLPAEPIVHTLTSEEPDEEMDWEPCNDEETVEQINEFRKTGPKEMREDLLSSIIIKDQVMDFIEDADSLSWIIVLDTNILVSSLNFIKDLRDTKINNIGYPLIYIPYRVLQELDGLKNNPQLKVSTGRAINYIHSNLVSSHPRFRGQSSQEYAAWPKAKSESADDDILQTCINLQNVVKDKKLVFLTNDKNLESKAILSGIKSYSKERFQKEIAFSKDESVNVNNNYVNDKNGGDNRIPSGPAVGGMSATENDTMLCELKSILKKTLIYIVETELKLAYGDDWKKLVKSRDWTLSDLIASFIKYWRSVFYLIFPKETLERVKLLKKEFESEKGSKDEVKTIVIIAQELLVYIKRCKEIRPYMDLVETSLKDLNLLLNPRLAVTENSNAPQNVLNDTVIKTEVKKEPQDFISADSCGDESHIEKIKNIFRDIWNFVRNFWSTLTNFIESGEYSQPSGKSTLSTLNSELPAVCINLQELIVSLEKVMLLRFTDISENNQAIIELSETLTKFGVSINPSFADIYLGDPLEISVSKFCGEISERALLENSINDFKEFFSDLAKGYKFLQSAS